MGRLSTTECTYLPTWGCTRAERGAAEGAPQGGRERVQHAAALRGSLGPRRSIAWGCTRHSVEQRTGLR